MLEPTRDLIQFSVHGTDYQVGQLQDILFEDLDWRVRYFVVEIPDADFGRKVLISTEAVAKMDRAGHRLVVNLTREKIENSPAYDSDMPVSRQYEVALRRYYEWPEYWGQNPFLENAREQMPPIPDEDDIQPDPAMPVPGVEDEGQYKLWPELDPETGIPPQVSDVMPAEPDDEETSQREFAADEDEFTSDAELRSVNEITGYYVHLLDGRGGFVEGLLVDPEEWRIKYLIVRTDKRPGGHLVLLAFQWVVRINWRSSAIYVHLLRDHMQQFPQYDPGLPVTPELEKRLYRVYDRIMYS